MNNDFWIAVIIIAVGGGSWLFKKGKSVFFLVRKIRRAFKGVCLNNKSTLSDEQCKKIAIGAMYASQQGAYQNSMETGVKDILPQILGEWWGIDSTDKARRELDYLSQKGFRYYSPFVFKAFLLTDPQQQDNIFQQNMTSQEDYDKIVSQFENLQETYGELETCKVVMKKEDLECYGVVGWDAGRLCFISRACCEMGYITEDEAWKYIDIAYEMAHSSFSSWRDMAMSYVIGRSLWGGKSAYNSVMKDTAEELLTDEKSPWKRYSW